MHSFDSPTAPPAAAATGPWWRELNGYQWFVFAVACLGWTFDTMDQRIFIKIFASQVALPSCSSHIRLMSSSDASRN